MEAAAAYARPIGGSFASEQPATGLGQRVRIVPRGVLVDLKFHAAISPRRAIGDKYQDVADISRIIAKRFDATDEALALEIAGHAFDGASSELAALIDDLRHGRAVKI